MYDSGGLNTEEEEDVEIRKRRRSTSSDSIISPSATPIPQVTYTTTMASIPSLSPKKITISKSPVAAPRVVASGSQTQKVQCTVKLQWLLSLMACFLCLI